MKAEAKYMAASKELSVVLSDCTEVEARALFRAVALAVAQKGQRPHHSEAGQAVAADLKAVAFAVAREINTATQHARRGHA